MCVCVCVCVCVCMYSQKLDFLPSFLLKQTALLIEIKNEKTINKTYIGDVVHLYYRRLDYCLAGRII